MPSVRCTFRNSIRNVKHSSNTQNELRSRTRASGTKTDLWEYTNLLEWWKKFHNWHACRKCIPTTVSERLPSRCCPTHKFHHGTSWRFRATAVKRASNTTTPVLQVNNWDPVPISFPVRWVEGHSNHSSRLFQAQAILFHWIRWWWMIRETRRRKRLEHSRSREKHSPIGSSFTLHFFRALAAFCVLYNRTEHSRGFFIC